MWTRTERSRVTFRSLRPEPIARYVATGNADDKAGAYGVQEIGAEFIAGVEGDLANVIGLPLGLLREGLRAIGQGELLEGRNLKEATLRAFPDLRGLPPRFLDGIPG